MEVCNKIYVVVDENKYGSELHGYHNLKDANKKVKELRGEFAKYKGISDEDVDELAEFYSQYWNVVELEIR